MPEPEIEKCSVCGEEFVSSDFDVWEYEDEKIYMPKFDLVFADSREGSTVCEKCFFKLGKDLEKLPKMTGIFEDFECAFAMEERHSDALLAFCLSCYNRFTREQKNRLDNRYKQICYHKKNGRR